MTQSPSNLEVVVTLGYNLLIQMDMTVHIIWCQNFHNYLHFPEHDKIAKISTPNA